MHEAARHGRAQHALDFGFQISEALSKQRIDPRTEAIETLATWPSRVARSFLLVLRHSVVPTPVPVMSSW